MDSSLRADTLAQYLSEVQWAVRPATLTNDAPGQQLNVNERLITMSELRKAVEAMRAKRAAVPDKHPVDFWKAIMGAGECALEGQSWLLRFCNMVWQVGMVPKS